LLERVENLAVMKCMALSFGRRPVAVAPRVRLWRTTRPMASASVRLAQLAALLDTSMRTWPVGPGSRASTLGRCLLGGRSLADGVVDVRWTG